MARACLKTGLNVKKILRRYMIDADIETFKDLSKELGIDYQTLRDRLQRPELFRAYELKTLREVLHLSDEDLLMLIGVVE